MILSCVKRIYDRLGTYGDISTVARTLRGSQDRSILEKGLEELSTYGLMRSNTRTEVYEWINHLEAEGYLSENQEKGLELTESAKQVLYRGKEVSMLVQREPEAVQVLDKAVQNIPKLSGEDADLYDILKELRSDLAKENGVPPFVIFSNATLSDMAKKKPVNMTAFKKVSGVGEIKAAWYGKPFVDRIRQFIKDRF